MLNALILIDNIAETGCISEWGFCVLIEYGGKKYLLDTGASDKYLQNVEKLGVELSEVDAAILSHAHFDHSGGYRSFFERNKKAKLYLSSACAESCCFKLGPIRKYIGIPKALLSEYPERLEPVDGFMQLDEGVWLVPHLKNRLEQIGRKNHLYRREGKKLVPDDFDHEQSLVFETEQGLAVFNSCSHGGLPNILKDIEHYLPGKHVCMTVGGLHLSKLPKAEVRYIAETIKSLGIKKVVTGHCTGDKAFEILREVLGDAAVQTKVGMSVTAD